MACEGLDLSKINRDEFVADNETVWIKAQVLEKTYRLDDKSYAVIEFSDGCFNVVCADQNKINNILLFVANNLLQAQEDDALIQAPDSGVERNENGAICGIPDLAKFEDALTAVDSNAINQFGFQPAALMPNACCIPLRSNIKIYGPYVSANFGECGGTNAESDPDLCPWAFGSAALMHAAGNAKANSYPQNFVPEAETGSITVPELPNINLGSSPAGGGPNLTGVNISFGSSGITTSYTFQTYTPKAGGFTRLFIDRLKNTAKYRQEQIKFLRNNRLDINKVNRRLRIVNNIARGGNNPRDEARANQPTAQRVLVGEIYDFHPDVSGQRTVVAMTTLPKAIQEMRYDFEKKAYMSLDGLLGPVSVNGDGGLPAYASYSGLNEENPPCHRASPISSHPPFATGNLTSAEQLESMDLYNLHIERKNINPVSNPGVNEYAGESNENSGHVIDILGRPSGTLDDGVITNFYLNEKNGQQYSDDYRFLGLRGPLVLHSWGFDTNGKPIPNKADDVEETKSGIFKNDGLKDEFLPDWLKKPMSWPVAPVDLRFDRDRGVWVSPPSYKIVVAKLEEDLDPYSKALASIVTKNTSTNQEYSRPLFDAQGNVVKAEDEDSDAKIVIIDRIGQSFKKDSFVYTYYDTHKCEYIILSGGQPKSPIVRFKLIDICPNLAQPPVDETWGDAWTEYAGYGDKFFDNISITDSYALRLNCNGEPIDKSGKILEDINLDTIKEHLIIVRDVAGKWGPAFSRYTNFATWKERAAEGYAVKIINPVPSGSGESSSSEDCDLKTPCLITYVDDSGNTKTIDENYDIIYLESYARYIHGCLKQDLYTKEGDNSYQEDYWKNLHPNGNALIEIDKFYGYSDNGKEPYYLDSNGEEVDVRVFDPWVSSEGNPIGCYKPEDYHLYAAKSGTPVVAVFNENLKRYDIIEIGQKSIKNIRFRLYNCRSSEASSPNWQDADNWTTYAGFFDKTPNNHILGVRIDCDGNPVDKNGKILTDADININNPNSKNIFVNLLDTAGKFGPSFAGYKSFNHWINNASTGFATLCSIEPSGNCTLGNTYGLCADLDDSFETYEIIFLESYARYIHGCLTQDLFTSAAQASSKYPDDPFKVTYPSGNASVEVLKYYGGADNAQEPKFYNSDLEDIPVRVFDPWVNSDGSPIGCYTPRDSQFYTAKSGTPFIAILNEKKKRYELVQTVAKPETHIRFKLIKICPSESPDYGDTWTNFAGYGDKFPNQHILGIRIDCDGNPIDINNKLLTENDLLDPNQAPDIFVNLFDTAGKFGPSYAKYTTFNEWKNNAANGFACKIKEQQISCSLGNSAECIGLNNDYPSFDILFLESYARFIHGCLDQDLYIKNNNEYNDDQYKMAHPSGNAAVASGYICYGDSPNGSNIIYKDANGQNLKLRVFDPWFEEVSCYNPINSQFYNATSGTPFTAVFNEDKKKYYLWTIDAKPKSSIRFRIIDCAPYSSGLISNTNIEALNDEWSQYASYGDKFLNNHILGIRITCDGDPIDKNGNLINNQDIQEAISNLNGDKAKNILVNLFDTCGAHGPSYAMYKNYADWFVNAGTGFGISCDPIPSGCSMGGSGQQCLDTNNNFESYDILFLESYSRFVECTLTQDLYPSPIKLINYAVDEYKVAHPAGNAAALINATQDVYGNSPNGIYPKFYKSDGTQIPFRVFDPYINEPPDKNPFRPLKEGDRVICVFNEKLKKYIIYSSVDVTNSEVIKFALVSDKNPGGFTNIKAVRINNERKPITLDGLSIITDQQTFENNWFNLSDPFHGPLENIRSTLGPALGSPWLIEHLEGMSLPRGYIFPFIGYALKHYPPRDLYGTSDLKYEIINMEHYAQYISGKVASTKPINGYYFGVKTYSTNGTAPITRELPARNADILLSHALDVQRYPIVGAEVDDEHLSSGFSANNIDGCRFVAILDGPASTTTSLIYNIVHAEPVAQKGTTKFLGSYENVGFDSININGLSYESSDQNIMLSSYRQGFMWDKVRSRNRYELTLIYHQFKYPHLTQESIAHTQFDSIDWDTGQLVYEIISDYPIAEHGIKWLNKVAKPGLFGSPHITITDAQRKINNEEDGYFQGIDPLLITNNDLKPSWQLSPTPNIAGIDKQEWMTFEGGRLAGVWVDRPLINGANGNINDGYYLIIHAQEAPVIITGKAYQAFKPEKATGIAIDLTETIFASSQGYNKKPLTYLLVNAENPMGYGALVGDYVTLQRVWSSTKVGDQANYKYIVIGTSNPPGPLK